MVEPHKSFSESGVEWVGHVSLVWWLIFDLIGGVSSAASWMYIHQFWAGVVTTLTVLSIFLTFLAYVQNPESVAGLGDIMPETPPPDRPRPIPLPSNDHVPLRLNTNVKIGTLSCSVYSDEMHHIGGASIVAENEYTQRQYRATTDRQGGARLRVPYGNYSVTVKAANHVRQVEAAKVGDNQNHLSFRLQMVEAERVRLMGERMRQIIDQLSLYTRHGTALLGEIIEKQEALESQVSTWEKEVSSFLQARLHKVHADLFLNDKTMNEYPRFEGTPFHANLTRVNTRVNRLAELTASLEEQVRYGML